MTTTKALDWLKRNLVPILGWIALILIVSLLSYWAVLADISPTWTGFGTYDVEASGPRAKTLWEWMELLIVPLVLVIGGFFLNRSQRARELQEAENARKTEQEIAENARKTEQEIAENRQQQASLEAYYDRMTDLLLEHRLRESEVSTEERWIARTRTLAVLRSLDGKRKGQVIQFLYEAGLIDADEPIVNLEGAHLHKADLNKAHLHKASLAKANIQEASLIHAKLEDANLQGARLSRARCDAAVLRRVNLREAFLEGTNLHATQLESADLTGAVLFSANLHGAKLHKAILRRAFLQKADLSGARLVDADLREARLGGANLCGANLHGADLRGINLEKTRYNLQTIWFLDFDPRSVGAILVD